MRERWQTASRLWEENKALANNLNLLGQLDYMGKLSSQLEWRLRMGAPVSARRVLWKMMEAVESRFPVGSHATQPGVEDASACRENRPTARSRIKDLRTQVWAGPVASQPVGFRNGRIT